MIKDYFEMTRHERRGAVVILLIIALMLAVAYVARCHRPTSLPTENEVVRQFEAEVDTSTVEEFKTSPKKSVKPDGKRSKRKSQKPSKKPKSTPAPRRMDPVPQF